MQQAVQKTWKTLLKTFKTPIKTCKICFKNVKNDDFLFLVKRDFCLCRECASKLLPIYEEFNVLNINAISIYIYNETIRGLLYQLKGCYDIELAPVFLCFVCEELHVIYKNYIVIPMPSSKEDDEIRGFNHVEEIFSSLKLRMEKLIYKKYQYKQSDHSKKERNLIKNCLDIHDGKLLENKNVLLVDDVLTTGSTMKAAISLVRKYHPKDIKILVISRTKLTDSISPN